MKILFVWPIAKMSVWDVARGYRNAFQQIFGEENVRDYFLDRHTEYHRSAVYHRAGPQMAADVNVVSQMSSETAVLEAIRFDADLVFIVAGLNFHPSALWLLDKANIPTAVMLTESPYDDVEQLLWTTAMAQDGESLLRRSPLIFTNERISARKYGWTYVPHSYDPKFHRPVEASANYVCDVLMIGVGWPERQRLLEQVNWDGVNLRLYGIWPTVREKSPIFKFVQNNVVVIDNERIAEPYCSAKICLNIHRHHETAESLGPRVFEVAGCGGFQLSDYRQELHEQFGSSVPVFHSAQELESQIHHYLQNEFDRKRLAKQAYESVVNCTFAERAKNVVVELKRYVQMYREGKVGKVA